MNEIENFVKGIRNNFTMKILINKIVVRLSLAMLYVIFHFIFLADQFKILERDFYVLINYVFVYIHIITHLTPETYFFLAYDGVDVFVFISPKNLGFFWFLLKNFFRQ